MHELGVSNLEHALVVAVVYTARRGPVTHERTFEARVRECGASSRMRREFAPAGSIYRHLGQAALPRMIGRIRSTKHGGLVMSRENSLDVIPDSLTQAASTAAPASPAGTSVSSTPVGGSPAGKARAETKADPRLDTLLQLVARTVRAKRELDKEETWFMEENNSILEAQRAIDKAQEQLDGRKDALKERERLVKRAREAFARDSADIDWKIAHPDCDREE